VSIFASALVACNVHIGNLGKKKDNIWYVDRCGQTERRVCERPARGKRVYKTILRASSLSTELYVWRSWPLSVLVLALVEVALALLGPLADLSAGGGEGANCALESDAGGGDEGDGWEGGAGGSEVEGEEGGRVGGTSVSEGGEGGASVVSEGAEGARSVSEGS